MSRDHKFLTAIIAVFAGGLSIWILARYFAGYLTSVQYVVAFILIEVMIAVVWSYRQRCLPLVLLIFVLAGTRSPLHFVGSAGRWVVLFVAAIAGLRMYLNEPQRWFGPLHGLAMLCILSSFASAVVSSYPSTAAFKALSLLLLLIYCGSGARLDINDKPLMRATRFLRWVELLIYVLAFSYFGLHYPLLGNPNSLGAVLGVIAVPLLFWGSLQEMATPSLLRRRAALIMSVALLFSSYARAGIMAAFFSCLLVAIATRRYRYFLKGIGVALVAALLVALWVPIKNQTTASRSPLDKFLYKGHASGDLLKSRRSVWDNTIASIRQHPFLGSGFGTSANGKDVVGVEPNQMRVDTVVAGKEHGNSYFAILEWEGLLGVVPFVLLLGLIVAYLFRFAIWIWRSREFSSPALPLAAMITAGLIHAGFEDWLFAVGYDLCVFFWIAVFLMVDSLPEAVRARRPTPISQGTRSWNERQIPAAIAR